MIGIYTAIIGAGGLLGLYRAAQARSLPVSDAPSGDAPVDYTPNASGAPIVQRDPRKVATDEQAARDAQAEPLLREELNAAIARDDIDTADAIAREMTRRGFKL